LSSIVKIIYEDGLIISDYFNPYEYIMSYNNEKFVPDYTEEIIKFHKTYYKNRNIKMIEMIYCFKKYENNKLHCLDKQAVVLKDEYKNKYKNFSDGGLYFIDGKELNKNEWNKHPERIKYLRKKKLERLKSL